MNWRIWIPVLAVASCLGASAIALRTQKLPHLTQSASPHWVGAFHVHSEDSHDSRLTWDTLARAAQKRGLNFLVITDHNKQRATSASLHGVTLLSYAELSTTFGHAVALGATYTLDKQQRNEPDVLARVRGAGGLPIVTHPSDLKRPWAGPLTAAAGIEIANTSAAARRYGGPLMLGLLPLAVAWPWQPELALAQLYDRDTQALALWDALPPEVVGLCGSDTHGWIDPTQNLAAWYVVLDILPAPPPTAADIVQALRDGRFHCSAGLLGQDPTFGLYANLRPPSASVTPPAALFADTVASLTLTGPTGPQDDITLVLIKDGQVWQKGAPPKLFVLAPPPGVYRGEVWAKVPQLLTGERWVPAIYGQRLALTAGSP